MHVTCANCLLLRKQLEISAYNNMQHHQRSYVIPPLSLPLRIFPQQYKSYNKTKTSEIPLHKILRDSKTGNNKNCSVLKIIKVEFIRVKATKAQMGSRGKVQLYSFLSLGSGWGWLVKATTRQLFPPAKENRYLLHRRLGKPQGRSGWVRKSSSPPVQPVESPYTNRAIAAHIPKLITAIKADVNV